jgi:hypothetical protein
MRNRFIVFLAVGLAPPLFVPSLSCGDEIAEKTVYQLKREVAESERRLTRSQRELAEARARLALAEGKRDLAITELRNAAACCQSEVQWIRQHANWYCDPGQMMTQAEWDLANARARAAEVDGDAAALVAEYKKVLGFHEQHVKSLHRLEQLRAVSPAEVSVAQEALGKARERLQGAEKRLAAEQAKKPAVSK